MTWQDIHQQLRLIRVMPNWGRIQSDHWDRECAFVYQTPQYQELLEKLRQKGADEALHAYALHRWFNFWSAKGIEKIFCEHPKVTAHHDPRHKTIDFYIDGIPFDHKTSIFPRQYPNALEYAQAQPEHLITWLYHQQSTGQRFHQSNRLFLILHNANGVHWQLRADLPGISRSIQTYLDHFNERQLKKIGFKDGKSALADLIWHCRS